MHDLLFNGVPVTLHKNPNKVAIKSKGADFEIVSKTDEEFEQAKGLETTEMATRTYYVDNPEDVMIPHGESLCKIQF